MAYIASMSLGMMNYWVRGMLAGEHRRREVEKADAARWIDAGVEYSGIMSLWSIPQDVLETVSPTVATLGGRSVKAGRTSIAEDLLGVGGAALRGGQNAIAAFGDPDKSNVGAAMRVVPFANQMVLRQALQPLAKDSRLDKGVGL